MWIVNEDTNKWVLKHDTLSVSEFESLKQDLKNLRFYQKCMSGSTYTSMHDVLDIYSVLNHKQDPVPSYTYNSSFSPYIISGSPDLNDHQISGATIGSYSYYEYSQKILPEYGMTLKNLFTPNRLIKDQIKNLEYVDLSTDQSINLSQYNPNLIIDGIKVKEGYKILVKDQYTSETIANAIDPEIYFQGNYTLLSEGQTQSSYKIFNSQNDIYHYKNGILSRDEKSASYSNIIDRSVSVKFGNINRGKQYSIDRLSNGFFPEYQNDDPILWKESHNYVLRNRMDYNNLFELSLKDTIKHPIQSISKDGITYSIPQRTITVGEFGSIIVHQESLSNIISSKFKYTLNSIDHTSKEYWICGNDGLLIHSSKIDLEFEKYDLEVETNLLSIDFFNDLRGVVVGKFNQIYHTSNGGQSWERIHFPEFDGYNFNSVVYSYLNKFYVGGDSGVFIEFLFSSGSWTAYKRRVSRFDEFNDEYQLVDDILSIDFFQSSSGILSGTSSFISIGSRNNNLFIYDLGKKMNGQNDFLSVNYENSFGDITGISYNPSSGLVFSTFNGVYKTDPFSATVSFSNVISATISSYLNLSSINSIFKSSSIEFILAGNNSEWISSTQSGTYSKVYDSNFFDRLKPKLLFADYDIGSKLYWFDDYGQYRIPERYAIPQSYLIGSGTNSRIEFSPVSGQTNWTTYWKDRSKTFRYSSDLNDTNKISPSFNFISSASYSGTFSISPGRISITYSIIQNLMPHYEGSRFRSSGVISPPANTSYHLYFYEYLGVWRIQTGGGNPPSEGDIIMIDSDVVSGKFMINRVYQSGGNYYLYFYTDFNENITNNLPSASYLTICNLNRYSPTNPLTFDFIFKNHDISKAFSVSREELSIPSVGLTQSMEFYAKYSQYSAYYNLQSLISLRRLNGTTSTTNTSYPNGFLDFGYTPTYNLLSYLSYIDPSIYDSSKEFFALPKFASIPGPDSGQPLVDQIWIDTGNAPLPGPDGGVNKLYFGKNLKNEWESFFKWTFIDVKLSGNFGEASSSRLLITNKYFDDSVDPDSPYVIELHDKLKGYSSSDDVLTIDIGTRRTLGEMSRDLQYVNTNQRPNWMISDVYSSGSLIGTYSNYESDINFKVPTDSYVKALLSDASIQKDLSGIIYTDYKYELATQIINLDREIYLEIGGIDDSTEEISFSSEHGLITGDSVLFEISGTQSSNWPILLGHHHVQVIDDFTITIDINWDSLNPPNDLPYLTCKFIKRDPFFNFQPVDIFDLGVGDKKIKQSVKIEEENYQIENNNYQLVGIDYNKYRFRLIDGLDLDLLSNNFPWILEAEISDAVIGMTNINNLIWYKGIWECGRWFGGTWISGTWKSGDWYEGTWNSKEIKDNLINVKYDQNKSNLTSSKWFGGRWFGGTWNDGTWYDGRWYGGSWNKGSWFDGTWNDGTWNDGEFMSGTWILGTWNNGVFNSSNGPSYWLDGKFYGGDFENGTWYDGEFNERRRKSRFGTKSSNTRNANWLGGKFILGEFHSYLNLDDSKKPIASEVHKYSNWETGFFSGNFYGGNVHNMNLSSGKWHGGILNDIDIISINSTSSNIFTLDGVFRFNIGDEIYVLDNLISGSYSSFGSTENPVKYKILDTTLYEDLNRTDIYVDIDLSDIMSVNTGIINTGLKCVSKFANATWNSGIWFNGVFESGNFNGGMWYNGNFSGVWG